MQVVVVSSVAIRKKRNSNKVEDVLTNDQASVLKVSSDDKPQSCVSVLRQCKHNQECRETLKTLKAKCTVSDTTYKLSHFNAILRGKSEKCLCFRNALNCL